MLCPSRHGSSSVRTTPLHPRFGVEIYGVDLRAVTAEKGYPEIREAFEAHSLLLFRGQQLDDDTHQALGSLFGPIEDRTMGKSGPKPPMDIMTNRLPMAPSPGSMRFSRSI